MSENAHFHPWELGFKQSGLRHITRVLHGSAINPYTTLLASPPCCCPLALSRPGQAGDPEASSFRTSTLCESDPTPSETAQLRPVNGFPVPLGRALLRRLLRALRHRQPDWDGDPTFVSVTRVVRPRRPTHLLECPRWASLSPRRVTGANQYAPATTSTGSRCRSGRSKLLPLEIRV